MLLYFTYNDQPSGVYWSQVTDVVAHLNTLGGPHVRLFALVSGRDYLKTRRAIKQRLPDAIVWPMVPRMQRWRMNLGPLAVVCRLHRPTGIICRGVMTTWMALRLRDRGLVKMVCFDARGAYAAEWEEYRIIDDDALIAQFRELENDAVNRSDFRLAVSNALVDHWRERYAYTSNAHVVIPCTLGTSHFTPHTPHLTPDTSHSTPQTSDPTLRLVYSGSTAGWQSFGLLEKLLTDILDAQLDTSVLFLSKHDANNEALMRRYPGRVEVKWLTTDAVAAELARCDVGILVRENTITNRVASPTKFAEYLAAGLPVLISNDLGDFSELVRQHDLGHVIHDALPSITQPSLDERARLKRFALDHFTKQAHDRSYRILLDRLA